MSRVSFFASNTQHLDCFASFFIITLLNANGYYYRLSTLRQHRPWSRRYGTMLIDGIRRKDVVTGPRRPTDPTFHCCSSIEFRESDCQRSTTVRPEPVVGRDALAPGPFMVRQAHHER